MNHQVTLRNIWITMSALCSGTGMKLKVYNGSTAACDGSFMFIPSHWVYTRDQKILDILLGVTVHEAMGHGQHTDFKQYQAYARLVSNMGASILNIFEDIYIETQCNKAKPGSATALSEMVTTLAGIGFFGTPQDFACTAMVNPASLIVSGLLNLTRARLLPGQDVPLLKNVIALEAMLKSIFGTLWDDIWDIAKNASKSTCTEDSIELTKQVLAVIAKRASEQPKPKPKSQPKQEKQLQSPNEDDDGSQSSDAPNDPGTPGDEGDAQSEGDDSEATSADGASKGELVDDDLQPNTSADKSDDATNEADDMTDVQKAAAEAEKEAAEDAELEAEEKAHAAAKAIENSEDCSMPETEVSQMASKEVEKGTKSCSGSTITINNLPNKKLISDKARQIATAVKGISDDLQDALLAETHCVRSIRMVGKRLNGRLLSRIRLGNPNVFVRKDVGEGLSTAVSFLFDDSGSMGNMTEWTVGLGYGLGDILDEFEVPFEIAAYSDEFAYAKHFEDDWTDFRKKGQMISFGGGTVTGGAAELVIGNLACRTEERRLLVLATDGDTSDIDRLESVYSEAANQGIEIASVMLGAIIPKIQRLASKFGFEAVSCRNESDLGRYVLGRILEAI